MPRVSHDVLKWARETAGLSAEQAAKKLGLGRTELLEQLERGDRAPTRRQLVQMSDKYRRPLIAFYLPKPPRGRVRGQDFRSLAEKQGAGSEALLDALMRDVQARQQIVKAALEEADEDDVGSCVGSMRPEQGVDRFVASVRKSLPVSLNEFRRQKNVTDAFGVLRAGVEQTGVFVLLLGNLGTHHTNIDATVFRGFALADSVAPFVVVNENDSRAAWSFTLLHELAHVWIGQTAISGYDSDARIERFCDEAASQFLLPPNELDEFDGVSGGVAQIKTRIDAFSGARNLSRKMVAYNLLSTGRIAIATYNALCTEFDAERIVAKVAKAEEDKGDSSPSYYAVRRHRVGPKLVDVVGRMVSAGTLSTSKAGLVLGVNPTAVGRMVGSVRAA